MAAQSLNRVRELVGKDLTAQVERHTRDFNAETQQQVISSAPRLIDRRRLRGIPMVGPGVSGAIFPDGVNPDILVVMGLIDDDAA